MKKKLYALSGVFLIVLVFTGLFATRAVNLTEVGQTIDAGGATSLGTGMSMREMAQGAVLIVIGQCVDTRSQWIEGRHLVTLATVSVAEAIKGDAPESITVALPGGVDANRKFPVAVTFAGAPTISPNENVFLFLTAQDDVANGYAVMGFAQGKFSIAEGSDGEKFVMRDMTREPVQRGSGLTRGNPQVVPLSVFKARVNSYLNK